MFLSSTTQRGKEQRALQTGRKDKTKAQMRQARALPHIPGEFAESLHINIAKFGICKVQRSQRAVPGKSITLNDQHIFQSKLMLLALTAMLAAPQCSCNCPLQHRAAAKQLWQEGFLRAGLPLLEIVSNSEPVPLPRWKYCPTEPSWNRALEARRACARLRGCGEVKVKSPEQPQCTLRTPAFHFLLQGSLRFAACTGYLWKALRISHAVTNLFPIQEGALGLCQFAEHFR